MGLYMKLITYNSTKLMLKEDYSTFKIKTFQIKYKIMIEIKIKIKNNNLVINLNFLLMLTALFLPFNRQIIWKANYKLSFKIQESMKISY